MNKWTASLAVLAVMLSFVPSFVLSATPASCAHYYNNGNQDSFGWASQQIMCQTFTVASDCYVTSIALNGATNATPPGGVVAKLYNTSGGAPTTVIETGATTITTFSANPSWSWGTSTFAGTTKLSAGTTYAACFTQASITGTNTNNYSASVQNTSVTFPAYYIFNGSTWSQPFAGFNVPFDVWGTSSAPSSASPFQLWLMSVF